MSKKDPRLIWHSSGEQGNRKQSMFESHVFTKVAEQFEGAMILLRDPEHQVKRFFEALQDGVPPEEAAYGYLGLLPDEWEKVQQDNPDLARIVRFFMAEVARDQYARVTKKGNGLDWLKANRPETWNQKQGIDITSNGKDLQSGVVIVQIPDNGRDSNQDNSPAAGATNELPDNQG